MRAPPNKLDFLTVAPIIRAKSWLLRVFLIHFFHLLTIFLPAGQSRNSKRKKGFSGLGAFLFLRKQVYDRSEGFEWIRLEVLDDAGTAFMMKRAGAKMGMVAGNKELELEWYPDAPAFVRGLEKNIFAALQYSLLVLFLSVMSNVISAGAMVFAPFYASSIWYGIAIWSALFLCLTVFGLEARQNNPIRLWEVYLTPIAFICFPLIAIRSAALTLWNGGVYWRTTFYPLSELWAHQRLNILKILKHGRS